MDELVYRHRLDSIEARIKYINCLLQTATIWNAGWHQVYLLGTLGSIQLHSTIEFVLYRLKSIHAVAHVNANQSALCIRSFP